MNFEDIDELDEDFVTFEKIPKRSPFERKHINGSTANKPQKKMMHCPKCGEYGIVTKDHIVPKFLYKLVNPHQDMHIRKKWYDLIERNANLRLLCQNCNKKKGSYFDFSDDRTIKLLKTLVSVL